MRFRAGDCLLNGGGGNPITRILRLFEFVFILLVSWGPRLSTEGAPLPRSSTHRGGAPNTMQQQNHTSMINKMRPLPGWNRLLFFLLPEGGRGDPCGTPLHAGFASTAWGCRQPSGQPVHLQHQGRRRPIHRGAAPAAVDDDNDVSLVAVPKALLLAYHGSSSPSCS